MYEDTTVHMEGIVFTRWRAGKVLKPNRYKSTKWQMLVKAYETSHQNQNTCHRRSWMRYLLQISCWNAQQFTVDTQHIRCPQKTYPMECTFSNHLKHSKIFGKTSKSKTNYEQQVSVYQRKIHDGDQVQSRYRSKKRLPCIRHMTKWPDLNSCTSSTFMTSNVLSTCF